MDNQKQCVVKLTFLGDAMWDWNMSCQLEQYRNNSGDGYDFSETFRPMEGFLAKSDYVMLNLETPISADASQMTQKRWEFCTSIAYARALKESGVDYAATANNHCLDRGIEGLASTVSCLDAVGLDHSGTYVPGKRRKPLIVEAEGLKLGILSYTYGTNAVSNGMYLPFRYRRAVDMVQEQEGKLVPLDPLHWYLRRRPGGRVQRFRDRLSCRIWPENRGKQWYEHVNWCGYRKSLLAKDIRCLRRHGADKIAVFLHIGGQYNQKPNAFTKRMTQWLEEKGVEFVIANHEHVIHGSKRRENGLTTYALGNYLGSAGVLKEPMDRRSQYSIAAHAYVEVGSKKIERITYSVLKTVYTEKGKFQVWPVAKLLQTLSEEERAHTEKEALLCAQDFSGVLYDRLMTEFTLAPS